MRLPTYNYLSGQQFWRRYASRVISAQRGMANIFAYCNESIWNVPDSRKDEVTVEPPTKDNEKSVEDEVLENFTITVRKRSYVGITIH